MPRILITSLLLLAFLLFTGFFVVPQYQSFSVSLAQKDALQKKFEQRRAYFDSVEKAWQTLQDKKELADRISAGLPAKPELGRLLYFLDQAASANGLLMTDINISPSVAVKASPPESKEPKLSAGVKETKLTLKLAGEYPAFKNFLSLVETSSRLIETENIALTAAEKQGSGTRFEVSLKVFSY